MVATSVFALGCGGGSGGADIAGGNGMSSGTPTPGAAGSSNGSTVIASQPRSLPSGIAVDASGIYWMDLDGCAYASNAGRIMKSSLGGASPTVLASGQNLCNSDIDPISAIALDSESVYWTSIGNGTVMKVNKDGSGLTTLATGQTLADRQSGASSVAVDATSVYWTQEYGSPYGAVVKAAKDGTHRMTIVSQLGSPVGLVVDSSGIYWGDAFDFSVHRAGLDGSGPTVLASNGALEYIALDSDNVYYTTTNSIYRVSKTGGIPFLLAQGENWPMGIAVDATRVYWTISNMQGSVRATSTAGGGGVFTVALPLGYYTPCFGLAIDAANAYFTCADDGVYEQAK